MKKGTIYTRLSAAAGVLYDNFKNLSMEDKNKLSRIRRIIVGRYYNNN